MKRTGIAIVLLTGSLVFAACKKSRYELGNNGNNNNSCRIVAIDASPNLEHYQISYDNQGRVSGIVLHQESSTYTYNGDTVFINTIRTEPNSINSKTVAVKNADGLAKHVRIDFADGVWYNYEYQYNGTQINRAILTASFNNVTDTATYTWTNGNMVSLTSSANGATLTYDYYLDKPIKDGDYIGINKLLAGYEIIRNKNLLKSIDGDMTTYNVGQDGKINGLSLANNAIFNYSYECH